MAAILKTEIEIIKLLGQSMACTIGKHVGEVCGGRTKRKLEEEASNHCNYYQLINWMMIFHIALALLSENVITLLLLRVGWLKEML